MDEYQITSKPVLRVVEVRDVEIGGQFLYQCIVYVRHTIIMPWEAVQSHNRSKRLKTIEMGTPPYSTTSVLGVPLGNDGSYTLLLNQHAQVELVEKQ